MTTLKRMGHALLDAVSIVIIGTLLTLALAAQAIFGEDA